MASVLASEFLLVCALGSFIQRKSENKMSAAIFVYLCIGLFLYTLLCNKIVTLTPRNPRDVDGPTTGNLVDLYSIVLWPFHIMIYLFGLLMFKISIQTK